VRMCWWKRSPMTVGKKDEAQRERSETRGVIMPESEIEIRDCLLEKLIIERLKVGQMILGKDLQEEPTMKRLKVGKMIL
ncbi:hypothetical protein Tco_0697503, partial [Tanacetum coccineum]